MEYYVLVKNRIRKFVYFSQTRLGLHLGGIKKKDKEYRLSENPQVFHEVPVRDIKVSVQNRPV